MIAGCQERGRGNVESTKRERACGSKLNGGTVTTKHRV